MKKRTDTKTQLHAFVAVVADGESKPTRQEVSGKTFDEIKKKVNELVGQGECTFRPDADHPELMLIYNTNVSNLPWDTVGGLPLGYACSLEVPDFLAATEIESIIEEGMEKKGQAVA